MTLNQLREMIDSEPPENRELEIKVWLPGSSISLNYHAGTLIRQGNTLMIEGNIDPGSALDNVS